MPRQQRVHLCWAAVGQQLEALAEFVFCLRVAVRVVGRVNHHAPVAQYVFIVQRVVVQGHFRACDGQLVGVEGNPQAHRRAGCSSWS